MTDDSDDGSDVGTPFSAAVAVAVTRRRLAWHAGDGVAPYRHGAFDRLFAAGMAKLGVRGRTQQTGGTCIARRVMPAGNVEQLLFSEDAWRRMLVFLLTSREATRWQRDVTSVVHEVPHAVARAVNVAFYDDDLAAVFPNAADAADVGALRPLDCVFPVLDYLTWAATPLVAAPAVAFSAVDAAALPLPAIAPLPPPLSSSSSSSSQGPPSAVSSSSSSSANIVPMTVDSDDDDDDGDDDVPEEGSCEDDDDDYSERDGGAFSDAERLASQYMRRELAASHSVDGRRACNLAVMLFVDVFGEVADASASTAAPQGPLSGAAVPRAPFSKRVLSIHTVDDGAVLQRYEAAVGAVRRCDAAASDAVRRCLAATAALSQEPQGGAHAEALWRSDDERAAYMACVRFLDRFDMKRTFYDQCMLRTSRWTRRLRGRFGRIERWLDADQMRAVVAAPERGPCGALFACDDDAPEEVGADDTAYIALRRSELTLMDLHTTAHWMRPHGVRMALAWADARHLYVRVQRRALRRLQLVGVPRFCAFPRTFLRPMPAPLASLHMSNYVSGDAQRVKSAHIALLRTFLRANTPVRAVARRPSTHAVLHRYFVYEWRRHQQQQHDAAAVEWDATLAVCRAFMWRHFAAPYTRGHLDGLFRRRPRAGELPQFQPGTFFVYAALTALAAPSDTHCMDTAAAGELAQRLVMNPLYAAALVPWPVATGVIKCVHYAATTRLLVGDVLCVRTAVAVVLRSHGVDAVECSDDDAFPLLENDALNADETAALRRCLRTGACMLDEYYALFGAEHRAPAGALGVGPKGGDAATPAGLRRALDDAAHCAFSAITLHTESWRYASWFCPAATPPGRDEIESRRISLQALADTLAPPPSPPLGPSPRAPLEENSEGALLDVEQSLQTLAVAFETLEYMMYLPMLDDDGRMVPVAAQAPASGALAAAAAAATGSAQRRRRSLGAGLGVAPGSGRKRGRPARVVQQTRASAALTGMPPPPLMMATVGDDALRCPVQWNVADNAWQALGDTVPIVLAPLRHDTDMAPSAARGKQRAVHAGARSATPTLDVGTASVSPFYDASSVFLYAALHRPLRPQAPAAPLPGPATAAPLGAAAAAAAAASGPAIAMM